ncbi:MAG: ATP-binding protein [Bacteroidales bacterium]|jgi:two-component system phosphate regulon sensor histidine kinase PhoR|nr:ATP-binding protein [Bacteroidales bacterium]
MILLYVLQHFQQKTLFTRNNPTDTKSEKKEDTIQLAAKENEINQLKKMELFRKEFLGNVAHELKTPLTALQGYILTLLDGGIQDDNINMTYLERSASNVDRMISIVSDLDEISKLEYKRDQLKTENFNLLTLVEEVIEILDIKATKMGVKIAINADESKQYIVNADRENIQKVLVNLIDNAIKYNDKTNGKVKISFIDYDKNTYMIEVQDNGIGIDEQYLPRIFERFFRVDKDRSRKTGGSGLGLAIVKHVIDAHKQILQVDSKLGEGSTFRFTLQKGRICLT